MGNTKKKKIREENLQKILNNFTEQDKIVNDDVQALLRVSHRTVSSYLGVLVKQGKLVKFGSKSNTFYRKIKI